MDIIAKAEPKRSSRYIANSGNIHTVTPQFIAYIACLMQYALVLQSVMNLIMIHWFRFALSSHENYSDVDGAFSMPDFYDHVLEYMISNDADEFRKELLLY